MRQSSTETRPPVLRSLRVRNYRFWLIGSLVSNIGSWMQRTAEDWLIFTELTHNDASMLGLALALQFGPALLLTPVSGYFADRFARKQIIAVSQSLLLLSSILLGIITLSGVVQLWHVLIFALVNGIVIAFEAPARQGFVSDLVERELLINAVSLNAAAFNIARMIGPALSGAIIAQFGTGLAFIANSLTFLVALTALWTITISDLKARAGSSGNIFSGFAYIKRNQEVALIFLLIFVITCFGYNFSLYTVAFTTEVFGRGAESFGLLSGMMAAGSLCGSLLSALRKAPRLSTFLLAAGAFSVLLIISSWAPNFVIFAAFMPLIGVCAILIGTTANSYIQLKCPEQVRGRVLALYMAIFLGTTPLGAPLMGILVEAAGVRVAMSTAGILCCLGFIVAGIWYRRIRRQPGFGLPGFSTDKLSGSAGGAGRKDTR